MKYLVFDVMLPNNNLREVDMDSTLKEFAFSCKFKTPMLTYQNILIPLKQYDSSDVSMEDLETIAKLSNVEAPSGNIFDVDKYFDDLYSIHRFLRSAFNIKKVYFKIIIKSVVDDNDLDIFYTDGSFKPSGTKAGYGCCKLLDSYIPTEEEKDSAVYQSDKYTLGYYHYKSYSGAIDNGTNNIGELTAIKVAIQNFDNNKKMHLIISDSIYGIKCFREYIYNWHDNGYLAYNGKPIKNKELICDTFTLLNDSIYSGNTVMFAWTKGHAGNGFNEICDKLAKGAIKEDK